jgi:hypothetical protein
LKSTCNIITYLFTISSFLCTFVFSEIRNIGIFFTPTQHHINNTMNLIQIVKHFNINKCFEFPFGTLNDLFLRRFLYLTNQLENFQTLLLTDPKCKSPFVKKVFKCTCLMFAQSMCVCGRQKCYFFQFFKYDSQVKNKFLNCLQSLIMVPY